MSSSETSIVNITVPSLPIVLRRSPVAHLAVCTENEPFGRVSFTHACHYSVLYSADLQTI